MHLTIVSCVFPPEPVVSAKTSYDIAEELVKQRYDVTVITSFPNRPGGKLYPGFSRRIYRFDRKGGINIIRCFATFSRKSSLLSRFIENITFGITSGFALLCMKRPSAIYSNTWPVFATGIMMIVAKIRKIPVVLSVQDIYPESLSVQGRTRPNGFMANTLHYIDGWIARQSQAVIVISKHFARIYREDRKLRDDRIFVIQNWGGETAVYSQERDNSIRAKYGITADDFLLVYGGNIGVAAGVDAIIQVMNMLPPVIKLLIAGEGSQLESCRDLARKLIGERVFFHTPWQFHETDLILEAADLCILPTHGMQTHSSVPSKLVSYMLAARPVVALAHLDTEIAEIIYQSGCGWIIEPEQPEQLAVLLEEVSSSSSQDLIRRGQAGREYALNNFSRALNIQRVIDILRNLATR